MEDSNVNITPSQAAQPVPARKPECTLAIASIVCGGLSFFFGLLTAIPAVICGHMALSDIRRNSDKYNSSSKTMSVAGLVLGYIFIGFSVLAILVVVMVFIFAAGAA